MPYLQEEEDPSLLENPEADEDGAFAGDIARANAVPPIAPTVPVGAVAPIGPAPAYLSGLDEPLGAQQPDLVPGMSGVTSDMLSRPAPEGYAFQVPRNDRYLAAIDKLEGIQGAYPEKTPPKWWQRGLAGVAGGLAGWSNAAGRTRNPIDIAHVSDEILHPGYADKLEQWKSRVVPSETAVQLEGQKSAAQWKGQQIQNETELKTAQGKAAMQHGDYWEKRADWERNQWKIDPKTGNLYNTVNGTVVPKAQTAEDRARIAHSLGATDAQATEYALNGKITTPKPATTGAPRLQPAPPGTALVDPVTGKAVFTNPARTPKEVDPLVEELRQQRLDDQKLKTSEAGQKVLDNIADRKNADERAVLDRRQKEIELKIGTGATADDVWKNADKFPKNVEKLKEINKRFAPQLQAIHDRYVGAARARRIDAPDLAIDPETLEYKPRNIASPQQPSTPKPGGKKIDLSAFDHR